MIYLASDHGGFNLKEQIKGHLARKRISFADLGPYKLDPNDDYPDFASKLAEKVSKGNGRDVGVLMCRSGQGVNIVANKFRKVRAALVWSVKEAVASRRDDLANILSLPTDHVSAVLAKKILDTWLGTPLGDEARHVRRIGKIIKLENKLFK